MDYLIIFLMCSLATTKVMLQSAFAKQDVKTPIDAVVYNGLIFSAAFVVFLCLNKGASISPVTMLFGMFFGILSVLFQLTYVMAFTKGPVSITVLINNFAMLIPILTSVLLYKETFTVFRFLGLFLTLVSLWFNVNITKGQKGGLSWLLLTLATFLANGFLSLSQKVFGQTEFGHEIIGFVCCAYGTAVVFSLLVFGIMHTAGQRKTLQFSPKIFLYAGAIGLILGLFQMVTTYGVGKIDGMLIFPLQNGLTTLMTTGFGVLIFREKLSKRQKIGILIGILAIILLSL